MAGRGNVSCIVTLFACTCAVFSYGEYDKKEAEGGNTLVSLIVAEQQKNLSKIHSLKLTLLQITSRPDPLAIGNVTSRRCLIRNGNCFWDETRRHFMDPKTKTYCDATLRTVCNEKYLAQWMESNPSANLWEYASPSTVPPTVTQTKYLVNPFPESSYAFGNGERSLSEFASQAEELKFWFDVTRLDAVVDIDRSYLIKVRQISSQLFPFIVLTIDPKKGYMVTHGTAHNVQNNDIIEEYWVTPREVAPGIWFPSMWEKKYYDPPEKATGRAILIRQWKITLEDIALNFDCSSDQFTLKFLGLKQSTDILRFDQSNELAVMRLVNNELIPKKLLEPK